MKKKESLEREKKGLLELEKKLKIKFKNHRLLIQVFTHSSYRNEYPDLGLEDNERLEFLGDAVIELVVSGYLYHHYPEREGLLTKWRAALVNTQSLAQIAQELDFGRFLLLSQGEKKNNERAKEHCLANTFEAFIGALYLDRGLKMVKPFLEDKLLGKLPEIISSGTFRDAKTIFQEKAQREKNTTPHYQVLSASGPDHEKKFEVGLFLEDNLIAQGRGPSKQKAEEEAASNALKINN